MTPGHNAEEAQSSIVNLCKRVLVSMVARSGCSPDLHIPVFPPSENTYFVRETWKFYLAQNVMGSRNTQQYFKQNEGKHWLQNPNNC